MHFQAEHDAASTAASSQDLPEGMEHAQSGWNAMLAEARSVQVTIEERAWLARLGAAAVYEHGVPDFSGSNSQSA